jgi:hypothetical protein
MHFDAKDVITISIAVVGAVLGIVNTWQAFDQRRVRLRVVPKLAHLVVESSLGEPMGCIEVVNLSAFPVSISEIGFTVDGDPRKQRRLMIPSPMTLDRQPLARTLESRHAVTGYFDFAQINSSIRKAYVRTDCGEVAYGSSPALSQIRRSARG